VEVDAGQEAHLVQWLSKRLGRQLVVPDLASAGFRLMGGRLLSAEDGPAVQFMYENGNGERLTLNLRTGVGGGTAAACRRDRLPADLYGWRQSQTPARSGKAKLSPCACSRNKTPLWESDRLRDV
jgi:anti-sigma factor RsiW